MDRTSPIQLVTIVLSLAVLVSGCNRAMLRLPTGRSLPKSLSAYRAKNSIPSRLSVALPIDSRPAHYGEKIAGTNWRSCRTDAMHDADMAEVVRGRFVEELQGSGLFSDVAPQEGGDLELRSEIHAFCAQAIGFVYLRVAGIVAVRFQLVRDSETLYDKRIESVVTDADPEYRGEQIATIQGAMLWTMADSLREVTIDLMKDFDEQNASFE